MGTDAQMAEAFQVGQQTDNQNPNDDQDPDDNGQQPETDQEKVAQSVEELPEWAQLELKRARREAAKYRNQAKKAPEAGTDKIRAEIRREFMGDLAAAKIEAALTGIVDDPTQIVDDLNLDRYITDEGEIDTDAVSSLKDRYARLVKRPAVGHGRNGAQPKGSVQDQLTDTFRSLGL
jgi:hypothetical protein